MRRGLVVVAACAGALTVGTPAASAAVNGAVYKCEGTATWNVSITLAGESTATRTLNAPAGACKTIQAQVHDDGNFLLQSFDHGDAPPTGAAMPLIGVGATGVQAFVGVSTGPRTVSRGVIVIAGDLLNATLVAADETPWTVEQVHTGIGSCGTGCYRTRAVWVGVYSVE